MSMNERETFRKGTTEPLVNNKDELISIIEALENENLVMYAAEEGQIILMWELKLFYFEKFKN